MFNFGLSFQQKTKTRGRPSLLYKVKMREGEPSFVTCSTKGRERLTKLVMISGGMAPSQHHPGFLSLVLHTDKN